MDTVIVNNLNEDIQQLISSEARIMFLYSTRAEAAQVLKAAGKYGLTGKRPCTFKVRFSPPNISLTFARLYKALHQVCDFNGFSLQLVEPSLHYFLYPLQQH